MNSIKAALEKIDVKMVLSTLWIFATANFIFCDVLGLMDPELVSSMIGGVTLGGANIAIDQQFLILTAIIFELPFAMILLSRILKYGINRWLNIVAGIVMVLIQVGSLIGDNTAYYIFYSIVEIAAYGAIAALGILWRKPEGN